jgi:hypothetical protein
MLAGACFRWADRSRSAALSMAAALALTSALGSAEDALRYTVRVQVPELEVASEGEVEFIVDAEGEYLIDEAFPATILIRPEVGDEVLVTRKASMGRADAEYDEQHKSMRWVVPVTAKKKGDHPVKVKMRFRVCEAGDDKHPRRDGDCTEATSEMRIKIVVKGH